MYPAQDVSIAVRINPITGNVELYDQHSGTTLFTSAGLETYNGILLETVADMIADRSQHLDTWQPHYAYLTVEARVPDIWHSRTTELINPRIQDVLFGHKLDALTTIADHEARYQTGLYYLTYFGMWKNSQMRILWQDILNLRFPIGFQANDHCTIAWFGQMTPEIFAYTTDIQSAGPLWEQPYRQDQLCQDGTAYLVPDTVLQPEHRAMLQSWRWKPYPARQFSYTPSLVGINKTQIHYPLWCGWRNRCVGYGLTEYPTALLD